MISIRIPSKNNVWRFVTLNTLLLRPMGLKMLLHNSPAGSTNPKHPNLWLDFHSRAVHMVGSKRALLYFCISVILFYNGQCISTSTGFDRRSCNLTMQHSAASSLPQLFWLLLSHFLPDNLCPTKSDHYDNILYNLYLSFYAVLLPGLQKKHELNVLKFGWSALATCAISTSNGFDGWSWTLCGPFPTWHCNTGQSWKFTKEGLVRTSLRQLSISVVFLHNKSWAVNWSAGSVQNQLVLLWVKSSNRTLKRSYQVVAFSWERWICTTHKNWFMQALYPSEAGTLGALWTQISYRFSPITFLFSLRPT